MAIIRIGEANRGKKTGGHWAPSSLPRLKVKGPSHNAKMTNKQNKKPNERESEMSLMPRHSLEWPFVCAFGINISDILRIWMRSGAKKVSFLRQRLFRTFVVVVALVMFWCKITLWLPVCLPSVYFYSSSYQPSYLLHAVELCDCVAKINFRFP